MNIDLKNIDAIIQPILSFMKRFGVTLILLTFLGLYSFLVFRISSHASIEPDEADVQAKVNTIARPRIDPKVIDTIEDFEQRNIEVQTIFQQARNNPFAED